MKSKKYCFKCGEDHGVSHVHFKVVSKLSDKGFPTHEKKYKEAHKKANQAEEKAFGKDSFKKLAQISRKLPKHVLEGKNFRSGKVEVSKKVPKRLRPEVAYHEKIENKILRRKK